MANYTPHQYLRFGGPYGGEEWSVGLRLQVTNWIPDNSNTLGMSTYIAREAEPVIRTFWTGIAPYVESQVKLAWVSCNHIGRDGKYTQEQSVTRDFTPIPGSGGSQYFNGPDVAVAVSLLTRKERGYAAKGRIYLPTNCLQLSRSAGSGWGTLLQGSIIANVTQALIEGINDLPGPAGDVELSVSVFSPGTGKKQDPTQPGAYEPVTKIRVGAQPDTMRRRLNKAPDLWGTSAEERPIAS